MSILLFILCLLITSSCCTAQNSPDVIISELEYSEAYAGDVFIEQSNNEYLHLLFNRYDNPAQSDARLSKYIKYDLISQRIVCEKNIKGYNLHSLTPTENNNAYAIVNYVPHGKHLNNYFLLYISNNDIIERNLEDVNYHTRAIINNNDLLACRSEFLVYDAGLNRSQIGSYGQFNELIKMLPYPCRNKPEPSLLIYEDSLLIEACYTDKGIPEDYKLRRSKSYRLYVCIFIYNLKTGQLLNVKEYDLFDNSFVQSIPEIYSGIDMYITDNKTINVIVGRSNGSKHQDLCWFSADFELKPFSQKKEVIRNTANISFTDPNIEHLLFWLTAESPDISSGSSYLKVDNIGLLQGCVFTNNSVYYSKSGLIHARGREEYRAFIREQKEK